MEQGLLEKTGKPLAHWVKLVKASKLEKHRAMIEFLKTEHGLTYGYANFVAHKTRASDAASQSGDDLLHNQYKGKESLQPVYEKILAEVLKFGDDISTVPKKAAVSLIRKHQFALIKPATKTRIDLGLKLTGVPITERLGDSGPFGTMCTHRVQLTDVSEVDEAVVAWIKEAYEKSV